MGKKKNRSPVPGLISAAQQPHFAANAPPVDSWRSYRDDSTNLQSLAQFGQQLQLNPLVPDFVPLAHSHSNIAHFTPYQFLRSVQDYARYPSYRVDKKYRVSPKFDARPVYPQIRSYSTGRTSTETRMLGTKDVQSRNTVDLHQDVLTSTESMDKSTTIPKPALDIQNTFRKVQSRSHGMATRSFRPGNQYHKDLTPEVEGPPAPEPTNAYIQQAELDPETSKEPQRLLVILDLNGTLLHRKDRASNPTNFQLRPGVTSLLQYLFKHHVVMIYTSARPENALKIINKLLHPNHRKLLAAVWARDRLELSPEQYNSKVQVYKKLEMVWADTSIQFTAGENRRWDQSNTILIDDSHTKALAQPFNLLQVPEFINDRPQGNMEALNEWIKTQQDIVKQLELKLEILKWTSDVSRVIRQWQIHAKSSSRAEKMPTRADDDAFHRKDIHNQPRNHLDFVDDSNGQLLTPRSPAERTDSIYKDPSDVEMDTRAFEQQHAQAGKGFRDHARSESPTDEAVWQELLNPTNTAETSNTPPQTPQSTKE